MSSFDYNSIGNPCRNIELGIKAIKAKIYISGWSGEESVLPMVFSLNIHAQAQQGEGLKNCMHQGVYYKLSRFIFLF